MQQFLTDSTWDDAAILRCPWQEVHHDLDDKFLVVAAKRAAAFGEG